MNPVHKAVVVLSWAWALVWSATALFALWDLLVEVLRYYSLGDGPRR